FSLFCVLLCVGAYAKCTGTVTSRLLDCCVGDIGKDRVEIYTLVPVSACPGHFDLSPNDIKKAKKSDYIFCHGFEPYVQKINRGNDYALCKDLNMLVPKHYIEGLRFVCDKLCAKDKKNEAFYRKNLKEATERTNKLDRTVRARAKKLKGRTAVCSVNNKPLLMYFGFNVAASFPVPDKITPKTWTDIVRKSKKTKIDYCIDNLQSGKNTSLQLSRDLKAKHLVTSNFPGGFPNTETYEKCLLLNLSICLGE
ncbi:MAG: zinc ABC transporter substrate-binding protein, partial [Armatimonadetes bacterium]|nr:zinc ABC transporter substrate-binding protein [Candidatus Hippobium faecium]